MRPTKQFMKHTTKYYPNSAGLFGDKKASVKLRPPVIRLFYKPFTKKSFKQTLKVQEKFQNVSDTQDNFIVPSSYH